MIIKTHYKITMLSLPKLKNETKGTKRLYRSLLFKQLVGIFKLLAM